MCCDNDLKNNKHRSLHLARKYHRGPTQAVCLFMFDWYKEMYERILKSLNIVKLYRGMFKLKLKINVKVPQLPCIVVFCGSEWRIWAIWWVLRWLLLYVIRRQGWKAHFWPVQREADFHPEIRIARLPNRTLDKLKVDASSRGIQSKIHSKSNANRQIMLEKSSFRSDHHPRHGFRVPRSNRHSVCSTLIGWC